MARPSLSFASSASLLTTGQWGVDRMTANFVYFLTGCYFSTSIRAAAVRAGWWPAAVLGFSWAVLSIVVFARPRPTLDAGFTPQLAQAVLPLLAVPFVLVSAPLIAQWPGTRALTWLGRNTLPVYVMHLGPISVIALALQRTHLVAGTWPTQLLPLALTVAAIAVILAVRPLFTHWAPWTLQLPHGYYAVSERHLAADRRAGCTRT